jgi:hypothetical protein
MTENPHAHTDKASTAALGQYPPGLVSLGRERGWAEPVLAWYADLAFTAQVGDALLLPAQIAAQVAEQAAQATPPASWLATSQASLLADHLAGLDVNERPDGPFVGLLRSLLAAGRGSLWPTPQAFAASALQPIAAYLNLDPFALPDAGASRGEAARDMGVNVAIMVYTFNLIAPPVSREFAAMLAALQTEYEIVAGKPITPTAPPPKEKAKIRRENLIAVDKTYAARIDEIHTPAERWDVRLGILSADKQTISLEFKLPASGESPLFDNIIDLIRPFLGNYGARVVQALYEIANDPPHWRNPNINVETNNLLDRLGLKRDERNVHRSANRERLRDTLNAAHNLTIIGEYSTKENGQEVRKAFRRTVLSLMGATFDTAESATLSTRELFERGLPQSMQIRLNFYDGVRKPDGSLGDQYILTPRLAEPAALGSARYMATEDLLRAYLLLRSRLAPAEKGSFRIPRADLLAKAGIVNKHAGNATATLRKALDKLTTLGIIKKYTLPSSNAKDTDIQIVLSKKFLEGGL